MPVLRQVPGFENFDAHTEMLHCDKPGAGLVDAPQAFSFKLSQVTKNRCRIHGLRHVGRAVCPSCLAASSHSEARLPAPPRPCDPFFRRCAILLAPPCDHLLATGVSGEASWAFDGLLGRKEERSEESKNEARCQTLKRDMTCIVLRLHENLRLLEASDCLTKQLARQLAELAARCRLLRCGAQEAERILRSEWRPPHGSETHALSVDAHCGD